MRKLILSFFILSMVTGGLYFTQKSSAAVTTTFQSAIDPLSSETNYTWRPNLTPTCGNLASDYLPYVAYTFDITTAGSYTFTMNASRFNGAIYLYQNSFNPSEPCGSLASPQNNSGVILAGSPMTQTLTIGPGLNRWVVVFSAPESY
jgi:hypothetical protein